MKLGLLARAEDLGLGIQTWEAARHLPFDRVLGVDMGALCPFPTHWDRYPGATVVPFADSVLPEATVRDWLDGLDAVFTCETAYDWRLAGWCAEAGARLVVQVNPEFFWPANADLPVTWWDPTTWRLDQLPAGTVHMPVPVALDRWPTVPNGAQRADGPLRVLHVAGRPAMADRNGTRLLGVALNATRQPMEVTVVTQGPQLPYFRQRMGGATVRRVVGGVENYWDLYAGHDVLVMPRRFGGLCLPVQEAMAAGLAVLMTDAAPQRTDWPVLLMRSHPGRPIQVAPGRIQLVNPDPSDMARQLDRLATDPILLGGLQTAGRAWAADHSWDALHDRYLDGFATACG